MPRPSNTDERRAQIAAAMLKVMARHGYDGASIADVARAAHLTPGLVHYHFESKLEILLAALDALVARHEARLEARLAASGGDPGREVAAFIEVHLGIGADADPEALACWVLLGGEALRQPRVRAVYARALAGWAARLAGIVRRGAETGVFRCGAAGAEAAASAVLALVQGYFGLAATAREVIPRGSAAGAARHMAEGLLRPVRPFPEPQARGAGGGGTP